MDFFQFAVTNARNEMSRYSADSDMDYTDEPWNRLEQCAEPGCIGLVSPGSPFIYCVSCLAKAAEAFRVRQERERAERVIEQRRAAKAALANKTEVA